MNETGLGAFLYEIILGPFPPCQPTNIREQRMNEHRLCPFIITDKFHKSPIYHLLGSCEYKKLKWFEKLTNMPNFLLSLVDKSESELAEIPQGIFPQGKTCTVYTVKVINAEMRKFTTWHPENSVNGRQEFSGSWILHGNLK